MYCKIKNDVMRIAITKSELKKSFSSEYEFRLFIEELLYIIKRGYMENEFKGKIEIVNH